MKRVGNLWNKITDIDNIKLAHKMASKDKSFYKEVKMVNSDLDYYTKEIQSLLIDKTYNVSEYRIQIINDKGKDRKLMKLQYYPDRIIQWAIMLQLERVFLNIFCKHTCASIPGRGIHKARKLVMKYMKEYPSKYCLKLDVRKFYDNIDHEILKTKLLRKIKDKDLLWLLDLIIDSYPGDKGVPIGSYLSQYFANFYLSDFDHYMKETLKIKCCVRYMDDVIILSDNKEDLHNYLNCIQSFLATEKLELKNNYQIFSVGVRGIDFLGFRFFPHYTLLRKKTVIRIKRLHRRVSHCQELGVPITYKQFCAVNSYSGWLIWCNSWNLWDKYISPIRPAVFRYYWNMIKQSNSKKYKITRYKNFTKKFNAKKGELAA